ncbi:hypothetical protein MUN77_01535 [Leucobacter allii]|uniref:hypothetical protein n=1 Tax=Leucobacter allii TaxID=2932247 RepID=UPI001FCFCC74|nr:hypothetical protein [Leucobacter allii]UOR02041.1 hypothetical protein MUN77_01535 [Leucobacter allii]
MTTTPNPTPGQTLGWHEFILDGAATTHIAYVYEDGSTYFPEGPEVVTESDFRLASAAGRVFPLVRARGLQVDAPSEAPTEEQVERALDALSRFNQWTENPRGAMRAALTAAGVAPQEPSKAENAAVARAIRLWTRQVRSELEATREANVSLGELYLSGMDSALRQAEEHAARIENDLYGDEPAPSPDREKLRIEDDYQHIYWFDPTEGCWVAYRRADCVGEEELPHRALAATPVGDEAALAEVIRPYDPDTPEDAAHAVAEWLRGGGR